MEHYYLTEPNAALGDIIQLSLPVLIRTRVLTYTAGNGTICDGEISFANGQVPILTGVTTELLNCDDPENIRPVIKYPSGCTGPLWSKCNS